MTARPGLGRDLMARIGRVMPVLPVPVIAHAIASGRAQPGGLLPAIEARFEAALAAGAPVFLPERALRLHHRGGAEDPVGAKILQLQGDSFDLTEEGAALMAFYARSVAPVLGDFAPTGAQENYTTT